MRIVWLAIIVVTAVPLAYVALLLNPFVYFALGPQRWQEQLLRLQPYRRAIVLLLAVCAFSIAVYGIRWG